MKLWYEMEVNQSSTPATPARAFKVSRMCRLDTIRSDAQKASIRHGNAVIFEMPAGRIIYEYRNGEVTYAGTGASR